MKPDDIALMLPGIWQRGLHEGSVTQAALGVMAALHGSVEAAIADPPMLADPRRAPDRLVPVLAMWLGLGRYLRDPGAPLGDDAPGPDTPGSGSDTQRSGTPGNATTPAHDSTDAPTPGDLRELTALAAALGRNRGTADSLTRFLQAATGIAGFTVTEDPQQPFHFHLGIPRAAAARLGLILRITEAEKPAFTTFQSHILADTPTT